MQPQLLDGFHVIGPDDLPLTPEPFLTVEAAEAFIPEWARRYESQGYYTSNEYGTIPHEHLPACCLIIPASVF